MKSPLLPIVLVGPMGVGKSTVGRKLARHLKAPFIDTDSEIIAKSGEISKIFETEGEPKFRELESFELIRALGYKAVVATGGGVVLSESNRKLLKEHNVIYLATDGKHIANRIQGSKRPLLKNGFSDWRKIYENRKPLYEEVATETIDTSGLGLKSILERIEGLL